MTSLPSALQLSALIRLVRPEGGLRHKRLTHAEAVRRNLYQAHSLRRGGPQCACAVQPICATWRGRQWLLPGREAREGNQRKQRVLRPGGGSCSFLLLLLLSNLNVGWQPHTRCMHTPTIDFSVVCAHAHTCIQVGTNTVCIFIFTYLHINKFVFIQNLCITPNSACLYFSAGGMIIGEIRKWETWSRS